ncbi:MAG: hydrolase 1, exosortase system-associated [Alphaproteobacteria bacterium]|nr:hydrolase 1, exosortase system-associated [Alphaproteobacteria bacterium]
MGRHMRRLLSVDCDGVALGASLEGAAGTIGLLMVTGGTQTRIGSHRMYERLAKRLAEANYPCFRFDRRGVGDSEGDESDWRDSGTDIGAAAAAFRRECPELRQLIGFGLCDGASALALHGAAAGLGGLILLNPWLVEAQAGIPAAAAVRLHYRQRLTSLAGWKKLLSGSMSYRKLLSGLRSIASRRPSTLAEEVAAALDGSGLPVALILAARDGTAIAAEAEWSKPAWRRIRAANPPPQRVDSDSHTFARPGDEEALAHACLNALERFSGRG